MLAILGSIANIIEEGLYVYLKNKTIFILASYDFCISTPFLKLEITIFVILNCLQD